jgi:chromosome segregation ATPase
MLATDTYAYSVREAWKDWRLGFNIYESAEDQMLLGEDIKALKNFEKALLFFSKIKKYAPNWKSKIIAYRLNLCRNKISSLKKKVKLKQGELTTAIKNATPQPLNPLQKELEEYKDKVYKLSAELKISKDKNKNFDKISTKLTTAISEKNELISRNAVLKKQYDDLLANKNKERLKLSVNDSKLIELNTKILELNKEIDTFKIDNSSLKDENSKLTKLSNDQQKAITKLTNNLNVIKQELPKYKMELADKDGQISVLSDKLDNAKLRVLTLKNEASELRNRLGIVTDKADIAELTTLTRKKNEFLNRAKSELEDENAKLKDELITNKQKLGRSIENIVTLNMRIKDLVDENNKLKVKIAKDFTKITNSNAKPQTTTVSFKRMMLKNSSLEKELSLNRDTLRLMAEQNNKLKSTVDYLSGMNQKLSRKTKFLESKIAVLNTDDISNNDKKILALITEKEDLKSNLANITAKFSAKEKEFNELNKSNKELKIKLSAMEQKLDDIQVNILPKGLLDNGVDSDSLVNRGVNSKKIATLEKDLKYSQGLVKIYKENLNNITPVFSKLKSDMKRLNKERDELTDKLKEVTKKLANISEEKGKLKTKLDKINGEHLVENYKNLKKRVKEIEFENGNLMESVQKLREIKIDPKIEVFVKRLDRKDQAINKLVSELKIIKADNEELSNTFMQLDKKLQQRTEKLLYYRDMLAEKQKMFDSLADLKNRLQEKLDKFESDN